VNNAVKHLGKVKKKKEDDEAAFAGLMKVVGAPLKVKKKLFSFKSK
jgi:hypothetical protein